MLSTFIKLPIVIKIFVLSFLSGCFTLVLVYSEYEPAHAILVLSQYLAKNVHASLRNYARSHEPSLLVYTKLYSIP